VPIFIGRGAPTPEHAMVSGSTPEPPIVRVKGPVSGLGPAS